MRQIKWFFCIAGATLLCACAHPIRIAPNADSLPKSSAKPASAINVGYFISDEERERRVISAGGGGDRIEYAPYKDLEPGIYRVLNNLFANVHALKSIDDQRFLTQNGITIVLRPTIRTSSWSDGLLTWPPTDFEIFIDIKASDSQGKIVWQDVARGKGHAEFAEFKSDFALSAKRAGERVIAQLQEKLSASPLMR